MEENGHNMQGIGELGSSSDSSDCSGFHNCRYGAKSIEKSHSHHSKIHSMLLQNNNKKEKNATASSIGLDQKS